MILRYSIKDIVPVSCSELWFVGKFEETPDPVLEWPHRHDFVGGKAAVIVFQ